MERKVIFRDRQEARADDPNNIQLFVDESLQSIITQAITPERMFHGGNVSQYSATELRIAPIHLWVGDQGRVYRHAETQTLSVFSHLPLQDKRWLVISVMGQEQDTDLQPRDFKVDLQTGQLEPRAVAMERVREVVVEVKAGLESPDPQVPLPSTGYTAIANVLLGSAGIIQVVPSETARLVRLFEAWRKIASLEEWKTRIEGLLDSLASDLAELYRRLPGLANHRMLMEVAMDVAELKERLDVPDDYSSYGADHFLTKDESDAADTEYHARVEEGVRFPWRNASEGRLTLFNPYEQAVKVHAAGSGAGLVLPAYGEVGVSNKAAGYAGSIAVGQYEFTTNVFKQGAHTRTIKRYGPTRTVCTNHTWWKSGEFDPFTGIFQKDGETWEVSPYEIGFHGTFNPSAGWAQLQNAELRVRQVWVDTIDEPYWYVDPETHTIDGAQIAQTLLMGRNGWLTGVNLFFDDVAADGRVHLHFCETINGVPDPSRAIGYTYLDAAALKKYPEATRFTFPSPLYVETGKRYAIILTTLGAHKVVTISGTAYTAGTLFVSTDGAFFDGNLEKDLMFGLRYASFKQNRTVVDLSPVNLDGGIADIELWTEGVEPASCEFYLEFQRDGDPTWYPMVLDHAGKLKNLPAMLKLRGVFVGTADIAPGVNFGTSILRVQRPDTSFKHFSSERLLEAASGDITVTLRLEGWNYDDHDCRVQLEVDGARIDPVAPDPAWPDIGYSQKELDADGEGDEKRYAIERAFTFAPDPAIDRYKIVITGSAASPIDVFHVAKRVDVAR